MSSTVLSVHIACSDYVTTAGLRGVLEDSGFIAVDGVSGSGTEALEHVAVEEPDLLLLDTLIVDHGVLDTMAGLGQLDRPPPTVLLADARSEMDIATALKAGACGLLVRGPTLEDIAAALRIIHRGGAVSSVCPVPQPVPVPAGLPAYPELVEAIKSLRPRDLKIVEAVTDGQTNAAIARKLHMSEASIKVRLVYIRNLLGAENRVQIAVAAVKARYTQAQLAAERAGEPAPASG